MVKQYITHQITLKISRLSFFITLVRNFTKPYGIFFIVLPSLHDFPSSAYAGWCATHFQITIICSCSESKSCIRIRNILSKTKKNVFIIDKTRTVAYLNVLSATVCSHISQHKKATQRTSICWGVQYIFICHEY